MKPRPGKTSAYDFLNKGVSGRWWDPSILVDEIKGTRGEAVTLTARTQDEYDKLRQVQLAKGWTELTDDLTASEE